jgi:hypothetical protein
VPKLLPKTSSKGSFEVPIVRSRLAHAPRSSKPTNFSFPRGWGPASAVVGAVEVCDSPKTQAFNRKQTSPVGQECISIPGISYTPPTDRRTKKRGRGAAIVSGDSKPVSTGKETNVASRMANVDSFDVPRPNAGEHNFYQNVTCYVHVFAPTTVHHSTASAAPETHAAVGSSCESDPTQSVPENPVTVAPNLCLIDLESVKRRRPGKRQALLEWLIRKLQRLLHKVT